MSLKGEKIYDIYKETHVSPWLSVSFLFRFLNYSETSWPPIHSSLRHLNFSSPEFSAILGIMMSLLSHPSHQASIKTNSHGVRTHGSHIFLSCSLQTPLCGSEMGRLFGEWQQKKIHKIGLPLSYVQREEDGVIQRRKFSYKGKGTGWVLEGFQGMRGCLQSWRPRERKDIYPVNLPEREA